MSNENKKAEPSDDGHRAFSRRQADFAKARMRQTTGRAYPKLEAELMKLTGEALVDLVRFLNDVQGEVSQAKRRAIHEPWRR